MAAVSLFLLLGTAAMAAADRTPSKRPKFARWANSIQLPTTNLATADLNQYGEAVENVPAKDKPLDQRIAGRRIPSLMLFSNLEDPELPSRSVPLPEANTLAHIHYQQRRFGRLQSPSGQVSLFNPELVLVKFRHQAMIGALRVESGRELAAVQILAARDDVELVELDQLEVRAFTPNDPLRTNQWHHAVLGSYAAWDYAFPLVGTSSPSSAFSSPIRVAIVDTPFQMDHPDLAGHTVAGWDAVANTPVRASSGIAHSTLGAGLVAAGINNGVGVAGEANCQLLPINVEGYISELCNAVYWAATNGVRVVNMSWSGADSEALDAAGAYLEAKARGLLVMAGGNSVGFLNYPNQPHIWSVAMTDAADNQRSAYGYHIDFAAPGWNVYSTTIGGSYGPGSGTSYATPLFCGVAALVMSINPTLGPAEVIDILKRTAVDKGEPGWDMWYGWGRVDAAAAARASVATLPVISEIVRTNQDVIIRTSFQRDLTYVLLRKNSLTENEWLSVTNATVWTNNEWLLLRDTSAPGATQWYRLGVSRR